MVTRPSQTMRLNSLVSPLSKTSRQAQGARSRSCPWTSRKSSDQKTAFSLAASFSKTLSTT